MRSWAMDQLDLEVLAADVRHRVGLRGDEFMLSPTIAGALIGRGSVRTILRYPTPATLIWLDGKPQIYVRRDAPDMNYLVAHELGHIALRWAGWIGTREREERFASFIGAAIIASPEMVRRAYRWFGESIERVAGAFYITQTSATLRIAEVTHEERAVVRKDGLVRVATFGGFPWASINIVEAARGRSTPELAKTKLTGTYDRGRTALKAG